MLFGWYGWLLGVFGVSVAPSGACPEVIRNLTADTLATGRRAHGKRARTRGLACLKGFYSFSSGSAERKEELLLTGVFAWPIIELA